MFLSFNSNSKMRKESYTWHFTIFFCIAFQVERKVHRFQVLCQLLAVWFAAIFLSLDSSINKVVLIRVPVSNAVTKIKRDNAYKLLNND